MVNILITADFYPTERVVKLVENNDVDSVFNDFVEEIESSDLAIINFECPIIGKLSKPIEKTGPALKATSNSIKFLKKAGFNLLTLANNHIKDFGDDGIRNTVDVIQMNALNYVGVGQNLQKARKYFKHIQDGISIGVVNISENEFSTTDGNYPGANPLDVIKNYKDIKQCREECDKVIVIYHGGHEGYQFPSPRMKELFHFYIDSGADVVACHHAHCFSGIELYKEKHIFYGLGNFVFDRNGLRNNKWNYGYAVRLLVTHESIKYEIIPYEQGNILAGVCKLKDVKLKDFYNSLDEINSIILNDDLLENEFLKLVNQRKKEYDSAIEPYSNRYLNGMYKRGFLPKILSKKKKLRLLNLIRCEAHKDLLLKSIQIK